MIPENTESIMKMLFSDRIVLANLLKNDTREKHLKTCISQKAQIEKAPDDNNDNDKIFFRKHENQFEHDLIAYLDFECELPKVDDRCERCHTVRCKCDTSYTSTRFETEQKPISFAFYIINKDNEILEEKNMQDLMLLKFLLYCFCY
jgi:hypothetical protein